MKNKCIWIINQTAGKTDSGWGERHYYLSNYWVKNGYSVKIISGSYNHLFTKQPTINNTPFTLELVSDKIEFCWVQTPKYDGGGFKKFWSNFVFASKLFFLSSSKLERPDIIIVSSMPIFPILAAKFLKKKFKASKLITEIRDLWPLTPIYLKNYSRYNPLIVILSWFEKFAYKKSDAIVSLLPNAADYINGISKDSSKFAYIPNGINLEAANYQNSDDSGVGNLFPKNKFIVGYAGTIGMANAMEYFVEASLISKNKDIHFVLVGDGYLKKIFMQKVKNSSNITFINKVDKSEVQKVLSYFDLCFVSRYKSPLYRHGVSYNKYFDYMLSKKPILVASEYIGDQVEVSGCGLIVEPESPKAIIEGIEQFLKLSNSQRTEMGQKGYDYVLKYHNYDYLSKLYLDLF